MTPLNAFGRLRFRAGSAGTSFKLLSLAAAVVVSTLTPSAFAQSSDLQPESEKAALEPRPVEGVEFKPGKGLSAASSDGDFSIHLGLRNQFRATIEKEHPEEGDTPDATLGFQIRRSRLSIKGNAFDKKTKYEFQLGLASKDVNAGAAGPTTSPLLDAVVKFEQLRDLSLRVGQYKAPYLREQIMSDGKLELVDRSLLNSRFTVDRDIGLDFYSNELFGLEQLHYNLGVFTGEGRNSFQQQSFGLMYLARVEVLPLGDFDGLSEGDFERSAPKLSIGAAYGYHSRAQFSGGTRGGAFGDGGTANYKLATADMMFKTMGLTLIGAVAWREGNRAVGTIPDPTSGMVEEEAPSNGWGFFAQAGYLIPTTGFDIA
ncbi:MAG: porin, partial [Polyangiaceae bacterium]